MVRHENLLFDITAIEVDSSRIIPAFNRLKRLFIAEEGVDPALLCHSRRIRSLF